ncbi:sialic acid-binding Ig-like lectin 7 [Amphiprion ocellaris]|uniref:sialic acid-binding Ig-like lectin 7 n=1 Tax=Amphiprion ocellaris TaxID=80972 RepID=UPI0024116991|nr:sialic acid-binding Ig-like lectin 7 [Amphiprion ocellaris]
MFVLIWAILLLSVSGLTAGKQRQENPDCDNDKSCIMSNEAKITAENGLCVVIPCTTEADFDVKSIIWHKCNEKHNIIIFNSHDDETIESGYKGRVSLLQSDLSKKNCSIIINDLTKSDSGLYFLRATGNKKNDCKIISKTTINVTDLSQKPTMEIPALTEGQQATLTCTAPGLCSGSRPNITWMWREAGGKETYFPGNFTFTIGNLTAGTRHSSTLIFTSSSKHHNTSITCKVSFKGGSAEETKTLNVTLKSSVAESTKGQSLTTVNSVSCNSVGEANIKDLFAEVLSTVQQLHGITVFLIGFVMGMLLSTIIACLVIKCLRKKQRRSRFLPENMEMVIAQSVPDLMDVGPAADYDVIRVQDAAEGGAESSGLSAPDGDMRPKEVEYSNIDFSVMKRRNPAGAEETQDTTETEYAEIKKDTMKERPDNGGEDGEVLEGNEEEKVVMIGEDEEAKQGMPAEEDGGKDVVLYSNANEVMDEV